MLFLLLHVLVQPYKDTRSNRLETLSLTMLTIVSALMSSFDEALTSAQTATYLTLLWISLAALSLPVAARFLHMASEQVACCRCGGCWQRWQHGPLRALFNVLVASDEQTAERTFSKPRVELGDVAGSLSSPLLDDPSDE